jgi:hypothetical protein
MRFWSVAEFFVSWFPINFFDWFWWKITKVPVKITRVPVKITRVSVKITRVPVKITRVPVKITRVQVKITRVPVKITRVPVKITRVPVKITRVPVKITRVPVKITRVPVKITRVQGNFLNTPFAKNSIFKKKKLKLFKELKMHGILIKYLAEKRLFHVDSKNFLLLFS